MISVVVPVYKIPEPLLRRCLESLTAQSFQACEFIVVDDGSPDNCGMIIDSFGDSDSRFRIFHTKNRGVSAARNLGLEKMSGESVLFLDGDDELKAGCLDTLEKEFEDAGVDVLVFRYETRRIGASESGASRSDYEMPIELCALDISESIIQNSDNLVGKGVYSFGPPWGKLFSAKFINDRALRFPEGIHKAQDRVFTAQLFALEPTIGYSTLLGYVYVEHPGSVCQRYNPSMGEYLVQTVRALEDRVRPAFPEHERSRFDSALPYFVANFAFSTIRLQYLHLEGPQGTLGRFRSFRQFCVAYRSTFSKCSPRFFETKAKRISVVFLRGHLYFPTFAMLTLSNVLRDRVRKHQEADVNG